MIKGSGVFVWFDKFMVNKILIEVGCFCLMLMILVWGGVCGDFIIIKVVDEEYMMVGLGFGECYY